MKVINEHIKKGEFVHAYLIYGEERYLVRQFSKKLKNALLGDGDSMNLSVYEGKGIDTKAVIDVAETMPFFAERRVVYIENSGFFKTSQDDLAGYLKDIPETTYFVFVEEEVDKRNKLYKTINDIGYVANMEYQTEAVLLKWIYEQFRSQGIDISREAIERMVSSSGTQMELLGMEIEKLISYVGDRKSVEVKDVEEISTVVVTNKIFDMVEAIARRQQKQALDMYYDLITLKEAPMRILFLIARHFNILMQIKEMQETRVDQSTMSKTVGLPSFVIKKYIDQGRAFSKASLKRAINDCVEAEEKVKTGNMDDRMAVELIIVKYSKNTEKRNN